MDRSTAARMCTGCMGRPSEPPFPTSSEPRVSILVNPGSHIPEAEGAAAAYAAAAARRKRVPQPVAKHGSQADRTRAVFTFCGVDDRSNGDDPRPIPAGLYVQRDAAGVITRVQQGYGNEGTIKTDGVDLSVEARWKSAKMGSFRHELRWSEMLSYVDDGTDLVGALGLPKHRITLGNSWSLGAFAASWNINVIAKNGTAEGRTASEYITHDIQFSWVTPMKGKLTLGMVNATGEMPQLVAYGSRNFNFNLYDSYGAQPYIRFEQKF